MGQKSANDNAANRSYPKLDDSISKTYVALTDATRKAPLYDSYIRAFRYATDRLRGGDGIVAFVSNGGWLDGESTAGSGALWKKNFPKSMYLICAAISAQVENYHAKRAEKSLVAVQGRPSP
jgi:predicted helicase